MKTDRWLFLQMQNQYKTRGSTKDQGHSTQSKERKSTNNKCEKRDPSHTAGGSVNWCSHYRKQCQCSLKKKKIEQPYDPATPFLGMYLENMKTLNPKRYITEMFTAALYKIAKTRNQHMSINRWTDEWIKKCYICTYIKLSHKRRKYCHLHQYGWT